MNILFVFSRHSKNPNDSTLTKDLADEFVAKGDNIYIITMEERRNHNKTSFSIENGCHVLRVKTGNYFNTSKVEKILTILSLPDLFVSAAIKYIANVKFDLIITHTPFVSSSRIIRPLTRLFACQAQLILWDIFPQNAVDLGLVTNKLLYWILKYKERKMLLSYDRIWCMSRGNVEYLRKHYKYLNNTPIDVLYNGAKIEPLPICPDKLKVRLQYGYQEQDVIAIFGGNMGIPQHLENILLLAKRCLVELPLVKFLLIGSGTESQRIYALAEQMGLTNTQFIAQIPRIEYELITAVCDIGLVSLDERFTVPNFPSKTTDYFKFKLPVFACIDNCAIEDYGVFLTTLTKAGVYARANDADNVFQSFRTLCTDKSLRQNLGENGRNFFIQYLDIKIAYHKIVDTMLN